MEDGLLTEILAVEQEIRQRVADLERETAARMDTLKQELAAELDLTADRLKDDLAASLAAVEESAQGEAAALLAEASLYAGRIGGLGDAELDGIVCRYLIHLRAEGDHDRQDEQA